MADELTSKTIRANRDAAMAALNAAYNAVGDALAQDIKGGPSQDDLSARWEALNAERAAIMKAATDEVLELPSVIAAAGELGTVSAAMTAEAAKLKGATNVLKTADSVLALGQQFTGLLKKA
jgi:hypothetical protein